MSGRDERPMMEQLLEVLEQCRDMLRKMHEAQKDLKLTIREAGDTQQEMIKITDSRLSLALDDAIKRNIALFDRRMEKAITEVINQFNSGFSSSFGVLAALSALLQRMYIHYESAESKLEIITRIREILDLTNEELPTNP